MILRQVQTRSELGHETRPVISVAHHRMTLQSSRDKAIESSQAKQEAGSAQSDMLFADILGEIESFEKQLGSQIEGTGKVDEFDGNSKKPTEKTETDRSEITGSEEEEEEEEEEDDVNGDDDGDDDDDDDDDDESTVSGADLLCIDGCSVIV